MNKDGVNNSKVEQMEKEGKRKRKTLSQQIEELKNEIKNKDLIINELKDKYLRLLADYDNFRKRTEKEIFEIQEYGGEKVLREILPIVDDLERAVNSNESEESLKKGIELIYKKLLKILKDLGVEPIESLGKEFDPDVHHALMVKETKDHLNNTVIEEFEKGYRYKDRILRHAKVVVGRNE
ncbi:MAG: nucleotide exchange factor GrpE [Candidatus Marinimicrobia bacterium]|nr:nucleotide exchange factor GrpE [Candidatus Neomarinimicrobiota bacterium]